jgi:DNA-directed RNA polymerase subunit RPC12/RpoP
MNNPNLNHIQNWLELAQRSKWSAAALAKHCDISRDTLRRHFLQHFGKKVPCPHCQTTIPLQKPKMIKMPCLTCNGNVEFSEYAVEQTVSCPHCQVKIILKGSS